MNVSYTLTFLNAEKGSLWAHLSINDIDHIIFQFVLVPCYILPVVLGALIKRELKKMEKYHWTVRLLVISIHMCFAAQLFWLIDLILISATGIGAIVKNENGAHIGVFETLAIMTYFLV